MDDARQLGSFAAVLTKLGFTDDALKFYEQVPYLPGMHACITSGRR